MNVRYKFSIKKYFKHKRNQKLIKHTFSMILNMIRDKSTPHSQKIMPESDHKRNELIHLNETHNCTNKMTLHLI